MAASKGYYSVMQYCPDTSRAEAANVGVVVFCPEPHALVARTTQSFARVKRFFKPEAKELSFIRDAVRAAATAFATRAQDYQTFEEFELAAFSMGNEVRLTPPKVLRVENARKTADTLFTELVESDDPTRVPAMPIVLPTPISQAFEDLQRSNRLFEPGKVRVPLLDRAVYVPYGYQNGVLNLIKPETFPDIDRATEDKAIRLAFEGNLIQKHPANGVRRGFIVVSAVTNRPDAEEHIAPLFSEVGVRLVRQEEAGEFARKVREEAK